MSNTPDGTLNAWKDLKGLAANIADWQIVRKKDAEVRDQLNTKIAHAESLIARDTERLQILLAKLNLTPKEPK